LGNTFLAIQPEFIYGRKATPTLPRGPAKARRGNWWIPQARHRLQGAGRL